MKIFFLFSFFLVSLLCFSQSACPIIFSYDESGNRIHRVLDLENCGDRAGSPPDAATGAVLSISAYPNPAKNKINIEIEQDSLGIESSVLLIDINGKTVHQQVTSALKVHIDVSKLASGTYLLRITRGKKSAMYNVLKN